MTKISIAALLAAAWAFSAPVYAQDVSASGEVSAEVSTEVSVEPSVEPSTEVSAEASGEVSAEASGEVSQPADDDSGASADFDIDTSLDIDISVEQTTQIRQVVIQQNVQPIEVDFDVTIGATVPSTVTLTPLPIEVIQLIPGFEGYLFFLLPDGRIVIVAPTTLQVVLIIYA